jgi:thiol-disulfide isomerase/thioredoxin
MDDQPGIEQRPPGNELDDMAGEAAETSVVEAAEAPTTEATHTVDTALHMEDTAASPHREDARSPARSMAPWLALGGLVLAALIAGNLLLLNRVSTLQDELDVGFAAVHENVLSLAGSLGSVSDMVGDVEERLTNLNALAVGSSGTTSAVPQAAVGAGLPRYDPAVQDSAVGAVMAGVAGPEYYSGEALQIDSADGKARAWLVWAHWCPYCQEELPDIKTWVENNAATFPDFEVVSLTTAMDESRGNPLVPYLEELQLPFPVIVDEDGSLSAQLGLNAFPFWVFTGPDGTVLGRTAGLLGIERFASIAQQLQDLASA